MRYFINLSYLGTKYSGWQRQSSVSSIQETIEIALSSLLKREVSLIGCGRTDTGVHAYNYIAHFEIDKPVAGFDDFLYKVNRMIPKDIQIHSIVSTDPKLHAQHHAKTRTYRYYFHLKPDPFTYGQSTLIYHHLENKKAIISALELLLGQHDFKAFCKQPLLYNNTLCTVSRAHLYSNKEGTRFYFEFTANRFLRSMIRILVYRLLLLGNNRMHLSEFKDYFITKPLLHSNDIAYPQGLVLYQIEYQNISFPLPSEYPIHRLQNWKQLS